MDEQVVQLPCSVCGQLVEVTATKATEYADTKEPVLCRVHWWPAHPEPVAVEAPAPDEAGAFTDESGTMLVIRRLTLETLRPWLDAQRAPGTSRGSSSSPHRVTGREPMARGQFGGGVLRLLP